MKEIEILVEVYENLSKVKSILSKKDIQKFIDSLNIKVSEELNIKI
jgi:hypothetical protein